MKVWIYSLVFAALSLAVTSQTCPSAHFSAVFVATLDQTIDEPVLARPDPLFQICLEMKLSSMHLRMQFIFSTGLDLSGSPPNEQNAVVFENAIMGPFLFPVEHNLVVNSKNWIQTGRTATSCNQVTNGGIAVIFIGDQTLHGSYGGTEGKPAGIGTLLLSNINKAL